MLHTIFFLPGAPEKGSDRQTGAKPAPFMRAARVSLPLRFSSHSSQPPRAVLGVILLSRVLGLAPPRPVVHPRTALHPSSGAGLRSRASARQLSSAGATPAVMAPEGGFPVETPALVVWRPAFDANRQALQTAMRTLPDKVKVRAHCKAHKSGAIAQIQTLEDGCVGVCAQKLSEAEAMVEAGIKDVLVSNEIAVTPFKTRRLTELLRRAREGGTERVAVCVDAVHQVRQLRTAGEAAKFPVGVMVELDVGHNRCGVQTTEEVLALHHEAAGDPDGPLYFAGIQAYHGLIQHVRDPDERAARSRAICERVRSVCDALAARNIAVPTVTGAGTGSFLLEGGSGLYTEVQPGSYLWMDCDYGKNPDTQQLFRPALFVASTVMSVAAAGNAPPATQDKKILPCRLVLDAGMKAIDFVSGPPKIAGVVRGDAVRWLSAEEAALFVCTNGGDEHCVVTAAPGIGAEDVPAELRPALGDTVLLIPGHCDPQVGLYDAFTVLAPAAAPGTAGDDGVPDAPDSPASASDSGPRTRLVVQGEWKINRSVGL